MYKAERPDRWDKQNKWKGQAPVCVLYNGERKKYYLYESQGGLHTWVRTHPIYRMLKPTGRIAKNCKKAYENMLQEEKESNVIRTATA